MCAFFTFHCSITTYACVSIAIVFDLDVGFFVVAIVVLVCYRTLHLFVEIGVVYYIIQQARSTRCRAVSTSPSAEFECCIVILWHAVPFARLRRSGGQHGIADPAIEAHGETCSQSSAAQDDGLLPAARMGLACAGPANCPSRHP